MILGAAAVGTLVLGACAHPDTTYSEFAGQNANVIVTFDKNGGQFASGSNIDINDVYQYEDAEKGIKILAPGDSRRGQGAADRSTVTRSGYQFIGWYTSREPRVENGVELDDYGEPCSETHREQGYVYSGMWDFQTQKLTLDDLTPTQESWGTAYRLTLYAAWAPNFTYDFYVKDASGNWTVYGSATRTVGKDLAVPAWNVETGRLEYNTIPVYSTEDMNYSMTGIYLDGALTQPVASDNLDVIDPVNSSETTNDSGKPVAGIPHGGEIDIEKGVGKNIVRAIYTTWRERTWYRIKTPEQFSANLSSDGAYDILADLNFRIENVGSDGETTAENLGWSGTNLAFGGIIEGNNHTIKNITTQQSSGNITGGGIFASVTEKAEIRNVTFENISFTVLGTTRQDGSYGLFAGTLNEAAKLTNVEVSGTLHLGDLVDTGNYENYVIGILSGNLVTGGISTENISVVVDKVQDKWNEETNDWDYAYRVKATVDAETGRVSVTRNETPSVDPNPSTNG